MPLDAAPPSYPEVQSDGTAVFHLAMPNAAKVELHLEGVKDPFPMSKGPEGAWSASVPKLAPQYYSYSFNVDGTEVLDPHNVSIKTSFFSNQNIFLVPGSRPDHGNRRTCRTGWCIITTTTRTLSASTASITFTLRPASILAASRNIRCSICCMDTATIPARGPGMGKANVILDNLIAQGKARPMIVVMPLGYGTMEVITRGWSAWKDPELVHRNYSRFSDALFQEVMPLVKQAISALR